MAGKQLDFNPWKMIWIEPRQTIRAIVRTNPKLHFWLLSWIYAFPILLHMAQSLSLGEVYPIASVIVVSAILAAFVGWVSLTIFAAILLWTGRWIGGKGTFLDLRAAVAWANVPNIVNVLLWAVLTAEFGGLLYTQIFPEMEFMGYQLGLIAGAFLLQLVVAVWSFVILLKSISEVQGFSGWKALLNMIMPVLLVIAASWLLTALIWILQAIFQTQTT